MSLVAGHCRQRDRLRRKCSSSEDEWQAHGHAKAMPKQQCGLSNIVKKRYQARRKRTGAETQTSPNDEGQRCDQSKTSQVVSEVEEKAGTTANGKRVPSNVSRERASMQACVPIAHAV